MLDPTLVIPTLGGLALGMTAAQIGGPISLNWRPRFGAIHNRLSRLPRAAPAAPLRAVGAVLVAGVLAGGTLAAYAAEPSAAAVTGAPERLAAQAAGVVGSGDQLSLKIKGPDGERTLKVGEAYDEGWTLQALTPTKATLAKGGAIREVGLNPTGAIASNAPAAPPSTVSMAGMMSEATIQAYVDRAVAKDPKAVEKARGLGLLLSVDEARRRLAVLGLMDDAIDLRTVNDSSAAARTLSPADQRALLGDAAFDDYWALDKKMRDLAAANETADNAAQIADLAARPVTGPTSYYVPAGGDPIQAAADQGIDRRGIWTPGASDANGGRTFTLVAGTAETLRARLAQPEQGPAPPAPGTPMAMLRMPGGQIVLAFVPGQ